MTINVKIKHDTIGSPCNIEVAASYLNKEGVFAENPNEVCPIIKPGEETTVTMWREKQLILREVLPTEEN